VPLTVDVPDLLSHWRWFGEWSPGCIGVLGDWLAGGNGGHTVLGASSDTTRSTPRKTRIEREAFRDPVGDQVPTRKMTLKCSFSGVISIDPKRFLDTGALNLNVEGHQVVGGQERLAECHDPHSVLLDGLSCDLGVQAHQAMSFQGGGYQAFIWQVW
jgi:hypothetical protein